MVGYVIFSVFWRLWRFSPPSDRAALVVAVGALLPDLIDKPLAWQFAVLPGGRSLAHSLFFAVPLVAIVLLVARRRGVTDVGVAFAVGYLSHLPADSVYPFVMTGYDVDLGYLIWPLASAGGSGSVLVVDHVLELVIDFLAFVTGPEGWRFLLVEGILFVLAFGLWSMDGLPGLGTVRRGFVRLVGA